MKNVGEYIIHYTDESFVCALLVFKHYYKVANPPRIRLQVPYYQCTDICRTLSWKFTGVQIFARLW